MFLSFLFLLLFFLLLSRSLNASSQNWKESWMLEMYVTTKWAVIMRFFCNQKCLNKKKCDSLSTGSYLLWFVEQETAFPITWHGTAEKSQVNCTFFSRLLFGSSFWKCKKTKKRLNEWFVPTISDLECIYHCQNGNRKRIISK